MRYIVALNDRPIPLPRSVVLASPVMAAMLQGEVDNLRIQRSQLPQLKGVVAREGVDLSRHPYASVRPIRRGCAGQASTLSRSSATECA